MSHRKLVQAIAIDFYHIYTLCCNEKCGDHIHRYGSARNLSDRFEYRCSHCPYDNTEIKIRIDETTKRCKLNYYTKNRAITLSKRDFNRQKRAIDLEYQNEIIKKMKEDFKQPIEVTFD